MSQLLIPSARGGTKPAGGEPLVMEVVRGLVPEDVAKLAVEVSGAPATGAAVAMRHAHHQLAMLLSRGMDETKAALVSGYSTSYVSVLKHNPAFRELLAHYGTQAELSQVDLLARMNSLGISGLEELQARLAERPEQFSNGSLMEMVELLLVKGRAGVGGAPAQALPAGTVPSGLTINVSFGPQLGGVSGPDGLVIDGEAENGN